VKRRLPPAAPDSGDPFEYNDSPSSSDLSPSLLRTKKKKRQDDVPARGSSNNGAGKEAKEMTASGGAGKEAEEVAAVGGGYRSWALTGDAGCAASSRPGEWTPYIVVDKNDWPRMEPTFNDLAKYLKSEHGTQWRQDRQIVNVATAQELLEWYRLDNAPQPKWLKPNCRLKFGEQVRVEPHFRKGSPPGET